MYQAANPDDMSYKERIEYMDKLSNAVDDIGLFGGYDAFNAWVIWRRSNYVVLPFTGGWLEQPEWVRDDFLMLDLARQWHDENAKRPSAGHLQNPLNDNGVKWHG